MEGQTEGVELADRGVLTLTIEADYRYPLLHSLRLSTPLEGGRGVHGSSSVLLVWCLYNTCPRLASRETPAKPLDPCAPMLFPSRYRHSGHILTPLPCPPRYLPRPVFHEVFHEVGTPFATWARACSHIDGGSLPVLLLCYTLLQSLTASLHVGDYRPPFAVL